ncbi:methionyl-tRNA synthetase [Hokovirus HKV1]|uniref:methionine--tRNA ligase n=1 Tax=Hokovirus HKV1 TaxID=1977638 RepID=A0A1V0SEZ7_9VIRU|nr:methionyl-tRNA synthetase [Hokovirus HKV1]
MNNIKETSAVFDQKFYITTAINYTNGSPHMGHAYEAILADIVARYNRIYGYDTFFLTGSDEHGQKILETAKKNNVEPIEICNKYYNEFVNLNKRLNISYDNYIRTTSEKHEKVAQTLLQKCLEAGDIYLGNYSGWYNVREETFISENEAKLSNYLDLATGKELIKMEESSYFFRLSKYHTKILEHITNNENFIMPNSQRANILARLQDELHDLSISRTFFDWGIKMHNDPKHVLYVWFDALANYISGLESQEYWPPNVQFIGKDITWFHCVIWPAILMSANIELPKTIYGHGFIHDINGYKMSKSLFNVIDPNVILDKYSSDSMRIYLINQNPLYNDLSFNLDKLILTYNADLADTIGNLVTRTVAILEKVSNSLIPDVESENIINLDIINETKQLFDSYDLHLAYEKCINAFKMINLYLTQKEPWKIKDSQDPTFEKRQIIVRSVLEAIYIANHLLYPFAPETSEKIFDTLTTLPKALSSINTFTNLLPNTNIKKYKFTKIEIQKNNQNNNKNNNQNNKNNNQNNNKKNNLEQHLFTKLDIRVGFINNINIHPSSDKLYCEEIDIGNKILKVASGLQQHIPIDQMQNKKVLVVCNLKSAKLAGFESEGMVLCVSNEEKIELINCDNCQVGERIFLKDVPIIDSMIIKNRKVLENVLEHLKTNNEGIPCFDNLPFMTDSGILCKSNLCNANIS